MAQDTQYGGFWARFVAIVLDNAIVFFILLAVLLSMGAAMVAVGMDDLMGVLAWVVMTLVSFLYWPVLESSRWQATFGKRIMGLEVTDLDGNRIGFLRAFLRSIAKVISAVPFGIGFLIAAFTARKQALHDIIVKTLVVRTGPSQLWKIILALIVGLALMVASAAGLFYYVAVPMFKKGFGDSMKEAMKDAPQMKTIPAPAPASKAPQQQAKPAAPAPQAAGSAAATGKQGPDPEFDAIVGKPLTGLDKPNTTRAGPAILELSTVFPNTVWVKVYLPVPSLSDPALMLGPIVTVNRVLDAGGNNYHDGGNSFEQKDFFIRPQLSPAKDPVPHLAGTRSVQLKPSLSEQALQKVEGQLNFMAPVDPKAVTIEAGEAGKEKPVHDSFVSLQSVSGNAARLHFRGASENLLQVRGFGADGKPLTVDSRQILPEQRDVDDDFTITFKGAPKKIEVTVAARIIERFFQFSLARGAVAGPPAAAEQGYTMPPRTRATKVTAVAPAAAPAPSPAPVIAAPVKPETVPVKPKPKPKPAPSADSKPRAAPMPAKAPAPIAAPELPRPPSQANAPCVYKPVMTDEDIARCR
jgi:uncharacterized RDD family membrane protein YckC